MEILKQAIASELALQSGFAAAGLDEKKISENLARPPKPEMGDVMFGCFKLAAEKKIKPNEMAAQLAQGFKPGTLVQSAAATGPYVNLRLNRTAALQAVLHAVEKQSPGENALKWRYGDSHEGKGNTLVVDLSSPNIAKPLAVHHLRSTMIGCAIKRLREAQGWVVVGVNHLGDWGTGFGKLIAGLKRLKPEIAQEAMTRAKVKMTDANFDVLGGMSVKELNTVYQKFNEEMRGDPELEDAGKREFSLLERDVIARAEKPDATLGTEGYANFYIYRSARQKSLNEFARIYTALGISFTPLSTVKEKREFEEQLLRTGAFTGTGVYIGESHWPVVGSRCQGIVDAALKSGAAEMSDGAVVMWVNGKTPDKNGNPPPPVILQKDDGASSYHLRDIASATYRHDNLGGNALAYVVGGEQKLHFDQLFKALKMLGHEWAASCTHVDFGLMLFKNDEGQWEKTSTRRGTAIMLEDLLDEAVKAVREIIQQKNPGLAARIAAKEPGYADIPDRIGVSAVVFNDLKNGRRNNVKFDWDAVLDFEGESGPYMQYQYVRMGSVLEKYREKWGEPDYGAGDCAQLRLDEEWNLALLLADFPAAVARASREYEPSIVARALIDLAAATSTWWTLTKDTRIVGEDPDLSLARVRLVNAIRKVLGRGLTLLGMQLVERM